ncbi:hypothetical protein V1514DRAFT_320067 [Lipomyces japonicus]|uniref:uncharacterized protein n=1 Tax=Lipomyces japonicus TaxID=56871 RepID=UPI0034CE3B10
MSPFEWSLENSTRLRRLQASKDLSDTIEDPEILRESRKIARETLFATEVARGKTQRFDPMIKDVKIFYFFTDYKAKLHPGCSSKEYTKWRKIVEIGFESIDANAVHYLKEDSEIPEDVSKEFPDVLNTQCRRKAGVLIRLVLNVGLAIDIADRVEGNMDAWNVIKAIEQITGCSYRSDMDMLNIPEMDRLYATFAKRGAEFSQSLKFQVAYSQIYPYSSEFSTIVDSIIGQPESPEDIYNAFKDKKKPQQAQKVHNVKDGQIRLNQALVRNTVTQVGYSKVLEEMFHDSTDGVVILSVDDSAALY